MVQQDDKRMLPGSKDRDCLNIMGNRTNKNSLLPVKYTVDIKKG